MSSGIDKSTHFKLWIIFGFFILIIVALLVVQISTFIDSRDQRENIEALRKAQTKMINSAANQAKADSSKSKEISKD